MRAAAILGLGCSPKHLKPFQTDDCIEWRLGMPASSHEADAILLFGGDGTVHRHLGQLVRLGLPVLVVPAGSGNDFASSLGLRGTRDSFAAWDQFRSGAGNVRSIDLGVITPLAKVGESHDPHNPRYFCCVAGAGIDGEVSRRANKLPRWLRGHGGYVLSLAPAIFSFAAFPAKVLTPGEGASAEWVVRCNETCLLAAFANAPLYGGGMRVAPKARMDDGLIDVCILTGIHPLKLLTLFPTVYAGRHLGVREVRYFQSALVRIETEQPVDIYADGEYVCQTPVDVSIERSALTVITPSV
jgi:diacylglycerol kinase (ATP)